MATDTTHNSRADDKSKKVPVLMLRCSETSDYILFENIKIKNKNYWIILNCIYLLSQSLLTFTFLPIINSDYYLCDNINH